MREELNAALKDAMKSKDTGALATLRLILAALKDRDIAARTKGQADGISNEDILQMLQTMVKQRRESIKMYEQGGRLELAESEQAEIDVIERFLPEQMDEAAIGAKVDELIAELGAEGLKDMGKVMGEMRTRYAGQMNFGVASSLVKEKLA